MASVQHDLNLAPITSSALRLQESQELEDPRWDAFLASIPGVNYPQSSLWARGKAHLGYRIKRMTVLRSDTIIGGAQMMIRPSRILGNFGFVPLGPVLTSGNHGIAEVILDRLHTIASEEGIRYLIVQPPGGAQGMVPILQSRGFQPAPLELSPSSTVLVHLSPDVESLFMRFRRQTRHNIRISERRGVEVRQGTEADLSTAHRLLSTTGQRHGYSPYSLEYLRHLWSLLAPAGCMKLFLAEVQGEAVSALFLITFGETATEWRIGWSGLHSRCYPNEAIHWAAIQWAATHGYNIYDLGGIPPRVMAQVSSSSTSGNRSDLQGYMFKLGFGGEIERSPRPYAYLPNPLLRFIHHAVPNDCSESRSMGFCMNWMLSRLR